MSRGMLLAATICLVVAAGRSPTSAQTIDDIGLWFAAFGNGKVDTAKGDGSRVRWWFDAHYRLTDDAGGFNQSIIRPGLGLSLTDNQALWAGYAWIRSSPLQAPDFDEHRCWQQWTSAPGSRDLKFLFRSRLEQRWVETGDDVGLRWRQLTRAQKIVSDCPQWSWVGWDELFFNLNNTDWGADAGLDQNRAFIGVGYKRCPHAAARTEVGYLNQFINVQGGTDRMNHILSVNFFF